MATATTGDDGNSEDRNSSSSNNNSNNRQQEVNEGRGLIFSEVVKVELKLHFTFETKLKY
jgi:hypothetical protein